jgi:Pectinacetylesterase
MSGSRALLVVAALSIAGIGAVGTAGASTGATLPPTDTAAAASSAPSPASAPVESAPAGSASASAWTQIVPGGDCECADGSEFSFWVRRADPTKVVFFLQGGGACFDAATCSFTDGVYSVTADADDNPGLDPAGVLDDSRPNNPFAGWSVVFVPYCTGDVHLGDAVHEYAPDLTVHHKGLVNGRAAVSYLADNFPDAEQVVVIGESAGSVASPLYGGLVADALPDAHVTVFGDGSGGFPDVPGVNTLIGGLWGVQNDPPPWPGLLALTPEEWSFPNLWVQAGRQHPNIVMSRFDYAFDATQEFFTGLAGLDGSQLMQLMDDNEARIESDGVTQHSYTAPGDDHTLVRKDEFYTMTVDSTALVDWVTDLVDGADVPDVHCVDCEPPTPATTG